MHFKKSIIIFAFLYFRYSCLFLMASFFRRQICIGLIHLQILAQILSWFLTKLSPDIPLPTVVRIKKKFKFTRLILMRDL